MATLHHHSGSKYLRQIHPAVPGEGLPIFVDVYNVIDAFDVRSPGIQHAIKKLLCAGIRGKGDVARDLDDAIDAIRRAIDMHRQREPMEDIGQAQTIPPSANNTRGIPAAPFVVPGNSEPVPPIHMRGQDGKIVCGAGIQPLTFTPQAGIVTCQLCKGIMARECPSCAGEGFSSCSVDSGRTPCKVCNPEGRLIGADVTEGGTR